MNRMKRITILLLCLLTALAAGAKEYRVALGEVAGVLKTAAPGDRIVIESSTYRDLELKWVGHGTEQAPIRIEADPEGAVITGRSSLRLAELNKITDNKLITTYKPRS